MRTANATAAVIRKGDETAARRLRAHGWLVFAPEELSDVETFLKAYQHAKENGQAETTSRGLAARITRYHADDDAKEAMIQAAHAKISPEVRREIAQDCYADRIADAHD